MRKVLILFILFLSTLSFSQVIYNPVDTTYTFTYAHLQYIKNNIENLKSARVKLEKEIRVLENLTNVQALKIQKLETRDSLYSREIEQYKEMDSILREISVRANTIMDNYKMLLLTTENQLSIETKKAKKERMWKQIYKYGYPTLIVAGIVTGVLIAK